ncbi:MAG: hypothetical protein RIS70_4209 [Planctomycetota bacterium]
MGSLNDTMTTHANMTNDVISDPVKSRSRVTALVSARSGRTEIPPHNR